MSRSRIRAFSLIELSIVLIIISLLVASVIAGKSLVSSSKYRSLISEVKEVQMAMNSFESIYGYIAGDLPNASEYFNHIKASCTNAITNSGAGTGCNGNGNNILDMTDTDGLGEMYMAWSHLEMAGSFAGSYTGYANLTGAVFTDTGNVFSSKAISGVLFLFIPEGYSSSTSMHSKYKKSLVIRTSQIVTLGYVANSGYLTPEEAFVLDSKYDDGNPKIGKITGHNHAAPSDFFDGFGADAQHCTTLEENLAATDAQLEAATYRLANGLKACDLSFVLE